MIRAHGPHYRLVRLRELVRAGCWYMTDAAGRGMLDVGLRSEDVYSCVLALTVADFKKSMVADRRPGFFQDVYNTTYRAKRLYVKLQIEGVDRDELTVVISFKAL